mmetsp:Transcript_21884/g.51108  ORF Transcript_21884/g.51108 Transcript_21884/m.51108 type:complete len:279 (+) Transcript_21884:196-1032(+)
MGLKESTKPIHTTHDNTRGVCLRNGTNPVTLMGSLRRTAAVLLLNTASTARSQTKEPAKAKRLSIATCRLRAGGKGTSSTHEAPCRQRAKMAMPAGMDITSKGSSPILRIHGPPLWLTMMTDKSITNSKQKTTEFRMLGMKGRRKSSKVRPVGGQAIDFCFAICSKSKSFCSMAGPIASFARRTPCRSTNKWMKACPSVLMSTAGSNSDLGGLTLAGSLAAAELTKPKKAAERRVPDNVSCTSEGRDPCRAKAAKHHIPKTVCSTMCCVCITMPAQVH